jgi:integrase/recombinase XerD
MSADFDQRRAVFLESLRLRGQAPATLAARSQALTTFARWLADQRIGDVREVSRATIAAYAQWLAAQPCTPHTRHAKLIALRAFFAHLVRTDALLVDPCAGLRLPPLGDRLPRAVLTREEARRVLAVPDVQTKKGLRDKAILELFYSTGVRGEEMARLAVQDVDAQGGFVRVRRGKGGRERIVPAGARACAALREYLRETRKPWSAHQPDERALWLSAIRPHGPMKKQAIAVMVKQCARAAGIERPGRTHLWRHTCATHLVAGGASVAAVQRLLGHRSLTTTQRYTRVAANEVRAMHAAKHPRSRAAATAADPSTIAARR